jgi:addiction module RelE/StbE family toxin
MQIIWLPKAVENLKEIREFIAKDSPNSASKVAESIKETVNLLKDNPYLGKPSLVDGFREKQVVGLPFVIPYKVVDSKIIIVRVFHNKRKPIEWNL